MESVMVFHDNKILEAMHKLAIEKGFTFSSSPQHLNLDNEWDSVDSFIELEDIHASFQIQQMPGCCAVLTLSYVNVAPWSYDNFDTIVKLVEEAAFAAGFGSIVMTQVVPAYTGYMWKNEPWHQVLSRGWRRSDPFRNAKSGNLVVYLTKDLEQPAKREGLERILKVFKKD